MSLCLCVVLYLQLLAVIHVLPSPGCSSSQAFSRTQVVEMWPCSTLLKSVYLRNLPEASPPAEPHRNCTLHLNCLSCSVRGGKEIWLTSVEGPEKETFKASWPFKTFIVVTCEEVFQSYQELQGNNLFSLAAGKPCAMLLAAQGNGQRNIVMSL